MGKGPVVERKQIYLRRIKKPDNKFFDENRQKINELLGICKRHQGEYLDAGHGSGSWATTYSNEFIRAAAELYKLFSESNIGIPTYMLSDCFIKAKILSCRRSQMNLERVEYLYRTHIKKELEGHQKHIGE